MRTVSAVLRPWLVSVMTCGALMFADSVAAVTMGEGYSATATGPAQYGWRAFTVPDFPAICEAAPDASRLEFDKTTMTLEVGDRFDLDGATIPRIRPREPSPADGSTQSDRGVADDPAGEDGVELQDREP